MGWSWIPPTVLWEQRIYIVCWKLHGCINNAPLWLVIILNTCVHLPLQIWPVHSCCWPRHRGAAQCSGRALNVKFPFQASSYGRQFACSFAEHRPFTHSPFVQLSWLSFYFLHVIQKNTKLQIMILDTRFFLRFPHAFGKHTWFLQMLWTGNIASFFPGKS